MEGKYMRIKTEPPAECLKAVEGREGGYLYSNILLKLLLKGEEGKRRRPLMQEVIPCHIGGIAAMTGQQAGTVEHALQIFEEMGVLEILDSGEVYKQAVQEFFGGSGEGSEYREGSSGEAEDGMEEEKKRRYQEGTGEGQGTEPNRDRLPEGSPGGNLPGKEAGEPKKINYQQIMDMYNSTCVSFPRLTKLSEARKKAIKARLRSYSLEDFQKLFRMAEDSGFLKGKNPRNWSASFDWLIKDSNMAKVLDGNYSSHEAREETGTSGTGYDRSYMDSYGELSVPEEDPFS